MTTPLQPDVGSKKKVFVLGFAVQAVVLLAAFLIFRHREIHVYDGFESDNLSSHWTRIRMEPGSFRTQSDIVRAGRSAGEITVHPGDRREEASDDGAATERDELMEAWWLFAYTGRSYRYSFSLYLPADFPIVPTRLVLAQWKQVCEWRRCRPQNPVLAIRYQSGELSVTRQDAHAKSILYSTKEEIRGRWLDFRFETRFFRNQDGQIDAWLNGERIVQYAGPTVYYGRGYPAHGYVYFKTGLYRDEMQQPMTIYLDEYRKDELSR
jgi:Polysaccharide lyase